MSSGSLLSVVDLAVTFPTEDGDVHAVRGLSFDVMRSAISTLLVQYLVAPRVAVVASTHSGRTGAGACERTLAAVRIRTSRIAYFDEPTTARSIVASVLSQAIDKVARVSLTLVKSIVNCSIDASPVRTDIGARSTSNFVS